MNSEGRVHLPGPDPRMLDRGPRRSRDLRQVLGGQTEMRVHGRPKRSAAGLQQQLIEDGHPAPRLMPMYCSSGRQRIAKSLCVAPKCSFQVGLKPNLLQHNGTDSWHRYFTAQSLDVLPNTTTINSCRHAWPLEPGSSPPCGRPVVMPGEAFVTQQPISCSSK